MKITMSIPDIILNIVKIINEKLEIAPKKDKGIAISLWDFRDENGDTIPKMDLKNGLRKLAEDEKLFQLKNTQCLDRLGRFAGEKIELEINREQFKKFYKERYLPSIKMGAEIYYDSNSGIGYLNGKKFKFRDGLPETRVFNKLYDQIKKKLSREEVLKLIGVGEEEPFLKEPKWIGLKKKDTDVTCLLYTSPSPRDLSTTRMPSSA